MNTLSILAQKKQIRVASVWRLLPLDKNEKPDDFLPVKRMDFDIEVEDDAFQFEIEDRIMDLRPVIQDSLAQNHHFVKYCGFWVDLFEYDFLVHIIGKKQLILDNADFVVLYCSLQQIRQQAEKG